jgi:hypothetical protein
MKIRQLFLQAWVTVIAAQNCPGKCMSMKKSMSEFLINVNYFRAPRSICNNQPKPLI